jgi:hypothetical protein
MATTEIKRCAEAAAGVCVIFMEPNSFIRTGSRVYVMCVSIEDAINELENYKYAP